MIEAQNVFTSVDNFKSQTCPVHAIHDVALMPNIKHII